MPSATTKIAQLNIAGKVMNFVVPMISFVPESIDLALNVLVFARSSRRRQPCSIYCLASKCCNLYIVFYMLPMRIASERFEIDPDSYSNLVCTLQIFILVTLRSISCWLIVLACADRIVISQASKTWRRRISSPKVAISVSIASTVFWFLMYCRIPICFNISAINQFGPPVPQDVAQLSAYRIFCPLLSRSSLFNGFITTNARFRRTHSFQYIRRQWRRAGPLMTNPLRSRQRKNNQLLRMLTVPVLVTVLVTVFYPIYRITYLSMTSSNVKSSRQTAIGKLVHLLVNGSTYIAHASSFHRYSATGSVFRKEVVRIFLFYIHHG